MPFWQRKEKQFHDSGYYLNTPVDHTWLNTIFIAFTIIAISIYEAGAAIGILMIIVLLPIYLFLRSKRKSHKQFLFIDHEKLIFLATGEQYHWDEYEFVFSQGDYIDKQDTEHINLSLNYKSGNKLKHIILHFTSNDVSVSTLQDAVKHYCRIFKTEEQGVEKQIMYDTRTSTNQQKLIESFERLDSIAFISVWVWLFIFVAGCIWNQYTEQNYVIPTALTAAIIMNSATKEICRGLFISKASQLNLTEVEARMILKKYALGMGYEGAGGAFSYYLVMILAVIFAFYINFQIIHP